MDATRRAELADETISEGIELVGEETLPTILAGRYKLEALLGAGGMGSVYRARDLELDELVALKMLKRDLAESALALERFRREVKLARRVTHRNVARTFDIGEHNGMRFISMELVVGSPLSAVLEEGPLSIDRARQIGDELCVGLAAAHAVGVVHRDLKPSNVMIAQDGRVVITDFGIARGAQADSLRTSGVMLGTPAYMAPEQVDNEEGVDARADIYAFGTILYELLAGERAWANPSVYRVVAEKLFTPPPDVRAKKPEIPEQIADVIMRCMARDREKRFATIEEVRAALSTISTTQSVVFPTTKRVPVHPAELIAAVTKKPENAPPAIASQKMSAAVLRFRNAGPAEDAYLADGLTDDLIDTLSTGTDLRVRPRGAVMKYTSGEEDPAEVGRALGVNVVVEGDVRRMDDHLRVSVRLVSSADGFQLWAKRFDIGLSAALSMGDDIARAVCAAIAAPYEAPPRSPSVDTGALDLYLRARHEYQKTSQVSLDRAIEMFEHAHARAPNDAMILSGLAMAVGRRLFFQEDEGTADIAKAHAERAIALEPDRAEARVALASVDFLTGDLTSAMRALSAVLKIVPENSDALELTGRALGELGRHEEAIGRLRHVIALEPDRIVLRYEVARLMALEEDWIDAEKEFEDVPEGDVASMYWLTRTRLIMWRRDDVTASKILPIVTEREFSMKSIAVMALSHLAGLAGKEPLVAEFERLAKVLHAKRRRSLMLQLIAEAEGFNDEADRVVDAVERAEQSGLLDVAWVDKCPLLECAREHPRFRAAREKVAARASAISAEIPIVV